MNETTDNKTELMELKEFFLKRDEFFSKRLDTMERNLDFAKRDEFFSKRLDMLDFAMSELRRTQEKNNDELRFEIEGLRSDYQSIKRNLKDLESDFRSEKSIDSAVLEMARFKERRYPLNGNTAMEEIKPYW